MARPRIKPPTFCGVRMVGSGVCSTLRLGAWKLTVIRSVNDHSVTLRLRDVIVYDPLHSKPGMQAAVNQTERWMQSIGVDTRKLAGRRAG